MNEGYRQRPGFLIREEAIVSLIHQMQDCFDALGREYPPPTGYTWGIGGTREKRELKLYRVDVED